MLQSPFKRVTEVVRQQPEVILREEGVQHKQHGQNFTLRNEWNHGFLCILNCGDTSGSASFTREGFFHCKQCGSKHDLYDWLAITHGTDAWVECKRLAERLGVSLKTRAIPKSRSMPKRMTKDILETAIHDLLESDQAEQAREFLRQRHLFAPRALAELGIGYVKSCIVFAQFSPKGDLLERYRAYIPGGEPPWRWLGAGSGGPGVWPAQRAPADGDRVLLLEGEWDVLTALVRLRLHRQGWTPCTFTSGAGSHPPAHVIPKWFEGREVHVAYDNDTFQGTDLKSYVAVAKPGKKLEHAQKAMWQRLANLTDRIVPLLEELGGTPVLRRCPIPPGDKWGADLRDWVDQGGRDLSEWTEHRDIPSLRNSVEDVPFDETFSKIGRRVRTVVQVDTVSEDDVIIPQQVRLDCAMGSSPACTLCPAVRLFPDRLIDLRDYPEKAARSLLPRAEKNYFVKHVVQPPRGCPGATVSIAPGDAKPGSRWQSVRPSSNLEDAANRRMLVISDEPPSLTGNVEVTGEVFTDQDGTQAFLRADKLRSLDRTEVDLRPHLNDFLMHCPHVATRAEEVDNYLDVRWRDLSANVTRIYGRRELTIAHDLLMHSVTELRLQRDTPQRGWLDIAIFGNTRSGKSATFESLMKHHELGLLHSAVSNISRAGLVMGTDANGMLRPGLFPRCNRKALVLDEWHHLVRSCGSSGNPASWIQTARDSGYADSAKISGNRKLPTRVRFATVANWTHGKRRHHQFDCQHLIDLYDTPESIARLDFAIAVNDAPTQTTIDRSEHFWTKDRTRVLIMRAWAMGAEQVHFEEGCYDLAREQTEKWRGTYETETIPLYTIEEKHLSILRIAVAVANICFSHPPERPMDCLVRKGHVRWAIDWLRWTWANNGYELYSVAEAQREHVGSPFFAERLLTIGLRLDDATAVGSVLGDLFAGFVANDATTLTGLEQAEANRWLAACRRANVFKIARNTHGDRQKRYVPTRGGAELLHAIIRCADEDPEHYLERYSKLNTWFAIGPGSRLNGPEGLDALGSNGVAVPF